MQLSLQVLSASNPEASTNDDYSVLNSQVS